MVRKIGVKLTILGSHLWEDHGFWIDKEKDIIQTNYKELPLLGKIGYNLMAVGFKMAKIEWEGLPKR